jgi:hypothetical protein
MRKALALSPDDRFQTAGEFQEALTRCAHRNGLLVSAPEVAGELVDLCGPPDQWRGEDDDDDLGYVQRAATEVYDGGAEDEEEEVQPTGPSGPFAVSRHSSARIPRPRPELAKGGVVELTSIINLIDLEQQHREAMGDRSFVGSVDSSGLRRSDPGSGPVEPQGGRTISGPPPIPRQALPGVSAMSPSQPRPMPLTALPPPPFASVSVSHPGPPRPADPSDVMPTLPRQLPVAAPLSAPRVPQGGAPRAAARPDRQVPHFQAPSRGSSHARKRSVLRPWMVIVAIILAAAVAGVIVALSGPNVAVQRGK